MYARILLLFFLISGSLVAQDRSSYRWYFGYNIGLNFNTTPPTLLFDGASNHREGTSSICDARSGELLFYTDGNTIWNRQQRAIASDLHPESNSSTQAAVIIRQPGSSNYYHVFSTPADKSPSGAKHTIVDMSLNNGLGGMVSHNSLISQKIVCEKIATIGMCNGDGYWVVFRICNTDKFYSYRLSTEGLDTEPVISSTGLLTTGAIGEMVIAPNGRTLVAASGLDHSFDVFCFDNKTGIVSNPRSIHTASTFFPYGVCFSPNGRWLYASTAPTSPLGRYDMLAPNIEASYTALPLPSRYFGQLELAPDGKIYVASDFGSPAAIENPDSPTPTCIAVAVQTNNNTYLGLPTFPQELKSSVACSALFAGNDTTVCAGMPSQIGAKDEGGLSYSWKPAAVLDNPTAAQPFATIYQTTTFVVTVSAGNSACPWFDTVTVDVRPALQVNITPSLPVRNDTVRICRNDSLTLKATKGLLAYTWSSGERTDEITVVKTGRYIVQATDGRGCVNSDTIMVVLHDMPTIVTKGARICEGESAELSIDNQQPTIQYGWRDTTGKLLNNGIKLSVAPLQTTKYIAEATNAIGCKTWDTVEVVVNTLPEVQANNVSICEGQTTELTISNEQATLGYVWKDEQGKLLNSGKKLQVAPAQTTRYIAEATNANGCKAWDTVEVHVNAVPVVRAKGARVCVGQTAELSVENGQLATRYDWKDEAGQSIGTGQSIQIIAMKAARYIVVATNAAGCIGWDTVDVVTGKTHLILSIDDSISAETNKEVEISIYAEADSSISLSDMEYTVRINATMFKVEGEDSEYENGDILIHRKQSVHLQKGKQEIGRIKGLALVSHAQSDEIRISQVDVGVDTNCVSTVIQKGVLHIEPVCANNLWAIQLRETLAVMPNPARDEISIKSDYPIEELRLTNSMGEDVTISSSSIGGKESLQLNVQDCTTGLYFVRARIAGSNEWITKSVTIVK